MPDALRWLRDHPAAVLTVCAVLLGVRFFSGVALAARPPHPATLRAIGELLHGYEVALAFFLIAVLLLLYVRLDGRRRTAVWASTFALLAVSFALWPDGLVPGTSAFRQYGFPVLAVAATALGSVASATLAPGLRSLRRHWWGTAYVALLVLVPAVLAMRLAAHAGVGTTPGPGGTLHGNWTLVHAPTFALELLAVGVWLYLVLSGPPGRLRRRPLALLPFLAAPVAAVLFVTAPLSETILSATISWGTNLAVFVPVEVSLTVAVLVLASYASSFLLVRGAAEPEAWRLLLLGTLAILLAGFFPSMASVAGLALGLATTGRALALRDLEDP